MGRAFAEVVATELAGAPGVHAIPPSRLHGADGVLGSRPVSAPGISAERSLALAAGATRAGYGEYATRHGRLEARLTIEDLQTGRMTNVFSASSAAGDVIAAASALARQVSGRAVPYITRSAPALEAYVTAIESPDAASGERFLQQAIAADPDFTLAYRQLALLQARRDRSGALEVLSRALARGIPEVERARIQLEAANLQDDSAARERALATLVKLDPADLDAWRSLAESAMTRHQYRESATAWQKLLAALPDDVGAWNQLGYAAAYAGDPATAVSALRRYQALRPADVNPIDSLGDVHLLAGHLREAEAFYLEASRKDSAFLNGIDLFKAAVARLMTGDVAGAGALARQYFDARTAARDPLVPYRQAEWAWLSGRRKDACRQLEQFARASVDGPLREAASYAYAELAMWSLALGDRDAAGRAAQKAVLFSGPSSAVAAALARFLVQPPASAEVWTARAGLLAPGASRNPLTNLALASALLLAREFQAALPVLQQTYESLDPGSNEGVPFMLAWVCLETGHPEVAAPLLRFNPIPPSSGFSTFTLFYFPRLYYLRAALAQEQGRTDEARANYRLFLQLSGPDPLLWGEEKISAANLR